MDWYLGICGGFALVFSFVAMCQSTMANDKAAKCLKRFSDIQFSVLNVWFDKLHKQQVYDTDRLGKEILKTQEMLADSHGKMIEEFVKWIPPGQAAPDTDTLNALRTIELLAFNATKKHTTRSSDAGTVHRDVSGPSQPDTHNHEHSPFT